MDFSRPLVQIVFQVALIIFCIDTSSNFVFILNVSFEFDI